MTDAGLIVIVALVSPFRADRARAAALLPEGRFLEIFVDTPIEVCRRRDPKGLYDKADRGRVLNLTGRDQPYEAPEDPDLVLRTAELTAEQAADRVVELVMGHADYGTSPNSAGR
jgi:bifunctional enzyme CysN/CysC